jgi:Mg2+ and Co2+ transporter CorA
MNVHFPGFGTVWAFWAVFLGMIAMLGSLLAFFRLKRWI